MTLRQLFVAGLLGLSTITTANAGSYFESNENCKLPPLPPSSATKIDWENYSSSLKVYQDCVSAKADKYGQTTKKALEAVGEGATKAKKGIEAVGEKVLGWQDSASEWLSR